jgi:hypothetical protein
MLDPPTSAQKVPRNAGLSFYLPRRAPRTERATVDRLGKTGGVRVLPKALPTVGLVRKGAAGPAVLHVGTSFDEPTDGAVYETH